MAPPGVRQVYTRRYKRDYPGSDVEGKHTSPPLTRAKRSPLPGTSCGLEPHLSFSINNTGCRKQDDSALRRCTPGTKVSTSQSVEVNGLVRTIICNSSPQPVQSGRPFPDAETRELRRVAHRRKVFQEAKDVVRNKKIFKFQDKTIELKLKKRVGKRVHEQENANDDEIEILSCPSLLEELSVLKKDKEVLQKNNEEVKEVNAQYELDIESLSFDCRALREENSVLTKDKEILQKNNEEVNLRYKRASQRVEYLTKGIGAGMKHFKDSFDRLIFWGKIKNSYEEPLQATQNSVLGDLELRRRNKHLQRVKQINSDSLVLTVDLQNCSREDEPPEELQQKQANDNYKHNATCGSYTDGEARPTRLDNDLSTTRAAVAGFQRALFECVDTKSQWSPWELLDCDPGDAFFARPNHSSHYFRSAVNSVFYEGFENQSFNTMCGVSRFPDPDHRREMFYKYYLREREQNSDDIEDPQFEQFCQMKVYSLLRKVLPPYNGNRAKVSYLEELGGPELVSDFKSTAKYVWLLHKLAFSFEPPATIFRVEKGADFDPRYMESRIVQLDDDARLVPKVGFMIDPGLRLPGAPIKRCEVYLGASATTIPDL